MSTRLADFVVDRRMLLMATLAAPIGALAAVAAWCLLRLIGLVTNLVFYQRWAVDLIAPGAHHHPWWLVLGAPVAGGLVVGVMARLGSEKISWSRYARGDRGHSHEGQSGRAESCRADQFGCDQHRHRRAVRHRARSS